MRFGQEHIGALVQGRYSLVTQQRGRVLGPAYQAHDHEVGGEVYLKLFVRGVPETVCASLERWLEWGGFAESSDDPWGPGPCAVGADPRGAFVVSPWVYGTSLRDGWALSSEPTPPDVVGALLKTVDALRALHAKGLVHGGLRASQVLLTEQASVILLRPGLDLFVGPTLTGDADRWALIRATRAQTWAPEVLAGFEHPDAPLPGPAADVFGFGQVIEAAAELLPSELAMPRDRLRAIAKLCAAARASDRPSLDDVTAHLDASLQRHRRPPAASSNRAAPGAPRKPALPPLRPTTSGDPSARPVVRRRRTTGMHGSEAPASLPPLPDLPDHEPEEHGPIDEAGDETVAVPPILPDVPTDDLPPPGASEADRGPSPIPTVPSLTEVPSLKKAEVETHDPLPALPPVLSGERQRRWTEAETFERYGLRDQAAAVAREVLAAVPNFRPAQDMLSRLEETRVASNDADEEEDFEHNDGAQTVLAPTALLPKNDEPPPVDDEVVPPLDENVQFTVYRPQALIRNQWADILFFAHLSEARPDASPQAPDPVAEVQRLAAGILGPAAAEYRAGTTDARAAIPREGTLTVIPYAEDVVFNPPQAAFVWSEDQHHVTFRAQASATPGQTLRGSISVFFGPVLVGDVPLALRVGEDDENAGATAPVVTESGRRYRKIFASYSRRDLPIVRAFEAFARGLGDRYLIDLLDIRSGEVWSERLEEMIRSADVFQLFWSNNSMASRHVLNEVQYALSLSHDIRPVFWERPLPQDPGRNLPPAALARFHFQFLAATDGADGTEQMPHLVHLQPPSPQPQPEAEPAPSPTVKEMRALPSSGLDPAPADPRPAPAAAAPEPARPAPAPRPLSLNPAPPARGISVNPVAPREAPTVRANHNDAFEVGRTQSVHAMMPKKGRAEVPTSSGVVSDDELQRLRAVAQRVRSGPPGPRDGFPRVDNSSAGQHLSPVIDSVSMSVPPARSGGALTAVLIAFGLALIIVSALMALFFYLPIG